MKQGDNHVPLFNSGDLIPRSTVAIVRLTIRDGYYNDPNMGWTDNRATRNPETGDVYLNVLFTVLGGEYADSCILGRIGLYSERDYAFKQRGYEFVQRALCSAHGVSLYSHLTCSKLLARIQSLSDLNNLEFLTFIDVRKDKYGNPRNVIRRPITCDYKEYAKFTGKSFTQVAR